MITVTVEADIDIDEVIDALEYANDSEKKRILELLDQEVVDIPIISLDDKMKLEALKQHWHNFDSFQLEEWLKSLT